MNSQIILAKNIKLDRNYKNVIDYSEAGMLGLLRREVSLIYEGNNINYIRETESIKLNVPYSQVFQASYMAFKNPDYLNKWFFCFIDNIKWINQNTVEIFFTVDLFSTFNKQIRYKQAFVVREHTNDDRIGNNTIPENIGVSDVECVIDYPIDASYNLGCYVAVESNWQPNDNSTIVSIGNPDGKDFDGITIFNRNISGNQVFLIKFNNLSDLSNLLKLIIRTNMDGHISDIKNMYIIPKALINESDLNYHYAYVNERTENYKFEFYTLNYSDLIEIFESSFNKPNNYSDITIKNNKCFCYPYAYLYITNNSGNNNIFKFEDFNDENCKFDNELSLSIGCSGRLVPKNYKGMVKNYDDAVPLGKYPVCGWSADSYTNWLTQNSVNIAQSITNKIMSPVTDILTLENINPVKTGTNIFNNIIGTMGQFYDAQLLPNLTTGGNLGDLNFGAYNNGFKVRQMRLKKEFLKEVDDYFTRFGYKTNLTKLPNVTGRKNFNYVEIDSSDSCVTGDFSHDIIEKLNNIFRSGVTIWHNYSNLQNYEVDNSIIV